MARSSSVFVILSLSLLSLLPSSEGDAPSTCLGQLAWLQSSGSSRYCSPGPFVELEFKLDFGCDPPTYLDQGIRLEARIDVQRWDPIRFYTPSTPLLQPPGPESLVRSECNGTSVSADAVLYTSSLPLFSLNSTEPVIIREYLCGEYAKAILNDSRVQFRWMQRYTTNIAPDVATWSLDDIKIRVWDGSCFKLMLSQDFDGYRFFGADTLDLSMTTYRIALGSLEPRECANGTLDFRLVESEEQTVQRRSLVLTVPANDAEACEQPGNNLSGGVLEGSCPLNSDLSTAINVSITCSYGSVGCGCGQLGVSKDNVACDMVTEAPPTTTEAPPTTTEAPPITTESPPTTTESPPTTTESPPTTTESPPTTTESPPTTTESPPTTTESPPTTTESPPTTTESPPTSTESPPTTTESPPTTTESPPTTTESPPTTTEAPPTTTESPPTTTESPPPTTEAPPTTTESPPTTTDTPLTDAPPTSIEDTILDLLTSEGADLTEFVDQFAGGSASVEVSKNVVAAADQSLQDIAMGSGDPSVAGRVLLLLDDFALRAFNSSQGPIVTERYTLSVQDVDVSQILTGGEVGGRQEAIRASDAALSLPNELFKELAELSEQIRIASFLFKNLSGVLPEATADGTNDTVLVSPVVSTTLGCGDLVCPTSGLELDQPVRIELRHFEQESSEEEDGMEFRCLFFDLERNVWSSEGCTRNEAESNSTYSLCECQHLTHFAVLLSPGLNITGGHRTALEIIGYVGVSISVFCMIITVFVLSCLKSMWGMRTYIHINLCVCLSIAQLLFVIAVDKTAIPELCQTVAIMLHYFFLASFMWMLMEGVVLYVALVQVFVKKSRRYILGFTVISYGLPALYLCLTVPLGMVLGDEEGPHYGASNASNFCWLRYDTHFVWAFITPVIVIILANVGFLLMAITIMCKHEKKGARKSKLQYINRWLKTSISLLAVMGITWIIGVLVFHQSLLFVAYIFTIASAFQGAVIFLLFVISSKQVKDGYNSWWRGKKGESRLLTSLFSSDSPRLRRNSTLNTTYSSRGGTFRSTLMSSLAKEDMKLESMFSEHNGDTLHKDRPHTPNGHVSFQSPTPPPASHTHNGHVTFQSSTPPPASPVPSPKSHTPPPTSHAPSPPAEAVELQEVKVSETVLSTSIPKNDSYFEVFVSS